MTIIQCCKMLCLFLGLSLIYLSDLNGQSQVKDVTFDYIIEGQVFDKNTERYISYANISIVYKGMLIKSVRTNPYGLFKINFTTNYIYKGNEILIRVAKRGYVDRVYSELNIQHSDPKKVRLVLKPKNTEFRKLSPNTIPKSTPTDIPDGTQTDSYNGSSSGSYQDSSTEESDYDDTYDDEYDDTYEEGYDDNYEVD